MAYGLQDYIKLKAVAIKTSLFEITADGTFPSARYRVIQARAV